MYSNSVRDDLWNAIDSVAGRKLQVKRVANAWITQKGYPYVKVGTPFKLLEVNPQLPAEIQFMTKTVFRLKVEGPAVNYEGPMSITMNDEPAENIGLNHIITSINTMI